MIYRPFTFATVILTTLLQACASPAPTPEPGMEVLQYGRNEEMQVAPGVDWNRYNKIILHTAPVEFRENWKRDQERLQRITFREEDLERYKTAVSDQYGKVMYKKLSAWDGYELTDESGAGVMRFLPRIVDLDIKAPGWVQGAMIESMVNSKGNLTFELVIRDSETDELLAVAWQHQSDPQEGYLEMTNTVNNTVAFRLMMQLWADWLIEQLEKAGEPRQ